MNSHSLGDVDSKCTAIFCQVCTITKCDQDIYLIAFCLLNYSCSNISPYQVNAAGSAEAYTVRQQCSNEQSVLYCFI